MTQETLSLREDAAHGIRATKKINPAAFFKEAKTALNTRAEQVTQDVLPALERYDGKWHPLGFMVFPMGIIEDLGILRLHVWPAGGRVIRGTGPGIHEHGWHLASKALKNTYFDELHSLQPLDAPNESVRKAAKGLTSFTVQYSPGQPDALVPDGSTFRTSVTERRAVKAGDIHTIEAGIFHVSSIPEERAVSTLVLDSLSLGFSPRVLLDAPPEPIYDNRQPVTVEQALFAKQQLL